MHQYICCMFIYIHPPLHYQQPQRPPASAAPEGASGLRSGAARGPRSASGYRWVGGVMVWVVRWGDGVWGAVASSRLSTHTQTDRQTDRGDLHDGHVQLPTHDAAPINPPWGRRPTPQRQPRPPWRGSGRAVAHHAACFAAGPVVDCGCGVGAGCMIVCRYVSI